jgi:transcriptional regulator with XRE-family HTH domain
MRNIGERIKFIREQKHITQECLAEKADVDRSLISKIETNVSSGSINTLSKIAVALDVPV